MLLQLLPFISLQLITILYFIYIHLFPLSIVKLGLHNKCTAPMAIVNDDHNRQLRKHQVPTNLILFFQDKYAIYSVSYFKGNFNRET